MDWTWSDMIVSVTPAGANVWIYKITTLPESFRRNHEHH